MNTHCVRTSIAALLYATACTLCACQTAVRTPIDEPSTLEGLQRVQVQDIDASRRNNKNGPE